MATHLNALPEDLELLAIDSYLSPAAMKLLHAPDARRRLEGGELLILPNAFVGSFAEGLYAALDSWCDWTPRERFKDTRFCFRFHYMADSATLPAEVSACRAVFGSEATKLFWGGLVGRPFPGPIEFGITRYAPGDYALPHSDHSGEDDYGRGLAFLWHLTKDWKPAWGGELYWCPTQQYVTPEFNTLLLFLVTDRSEHMVTPVSPFAQGKRLSVTGWWTHPSRALP
jgi:hypothetical protein